MTINNELNVNDILLSEIREMSKDQKDTNKKIDEILDRLKTIEIVTIGVDGKNGLKGDVIGIEKKIEDVQKLNILVEGDNGLFNRIKNLEQEVDRLRTFKIKVITYYSAAQVIFGVLWVLAIKFKLI
jgi:hypothetical protein